MGVFVIFFNHIRVLGIKTLAIVIFSGLLTPMFTDLSLGQGVLIGILISVLTYILGDLVVLPVTDNTAATAADVATAGVLYWISVRALDGIGLSFWEALAFALIVGVSEWFLHTYLVRYVLKRDKAA
ncbi:MAG: DUF2512 family protein [Bacillota bacterium]